MLLSDPNGAASVSRLQLLIFTLVVAISLFILVEKNGTFPPISDGILTLLGISASTYAVSKGISFSRDEGVTTPEERAAKAQAASDAAVALVQATTPIPAPAQPNVAVAGAGGVVVQQQADQGQAKDE